MIFSSTLIHNRKLFKKFQSLKPPPLSSPAVAGEEEGGGLNRLNDSNASNLYMTSLSVV